MNQQKKNFIAFGYLNYVLFTRKIDKEIFTYTIQMNIVDIFLKLRKD